MTIEILAFAQARRTLGFSSRHVECQPADSPRSILQPWLESIATLPPCRIAVDEHLHEWDAPVGQARVLAILPPVSGG